MFPDKQLLLFSILRILKGIVLSRLQGRSNLSPDKVPWSALRALLSQAIYGGRIDNDFDQVRDSPNLS